MKFIVIVPDGMADQPLEELGQKTPMEVAHTANLDFMSQNGFTGLVQTIPPGMKPGSDVGNLSVMGYDPHICFSGRAPLEAANLGIKLKDDEVAFRCNLVTMDENRMLDYSSGHISTEEAAKLIGALNEELSEKGIRFVAGKSYRHLLILKVNNVDATVKIKCTPPHDIMGQEVPKFLPHGQGAMALLRLMEKARDILANHPVNNVRIDLKENPANNIWLWGQGTKPSVPSFEDKFGVEGSIISAVDLVNGIGRLAGLKVVKVPGITGYYDTNFRGKAEYALKSLKKRDFVFIHIEAPDEAGHNGDAKAKVTSIENIDREVIGPVLNHFNEQDDFRILVLPDHPTPVALRTHTSDPVPFVMYGRRIPQDGSEELNERSAKEKGLRFKSGEALMDEFMKRYI